MSEERILFIDTKTNVSDAIYDRIMVCMSPDSLNNHHDDVINLG